MVEAGHAVAYTRYSWRYVPEGLRERAAAPALGHELR